MKKNLSDQIIQYEKWLIAKKKPVLVLQQLIDDDFMEMGQSGQIYNKNEVVAWLNRQSQSLREGFQFQVKQISEEVLLLTYLSRIKTQGADEAKHAFRSSIWRNQGEQWRMVFHQATPIPALT
ncbi:nuclear transport factor 2 family protein [Legionella impletisoli]|uniref:DUF4440 domain-containing protein n=1 Tax=Legionella impletisoli TaxID=343510 RepID=A0A917JYJ4_9GAMM|nr:DUF4440 domain-containing protein [Legionella impletisoli]GGI88327.1 hypothetical protein GCM10007966_16380 [Legionella impletisoli]